MPRAAGTTECAPGASAGAASWVQGDAAADPPLPLPRDPLARSLVERAGAAQRQQEARRSAAMRSAQADFPPGAPEAAMADQELLRRAYSQAGPWDAHERGVENALQRQIRERHDALDLPIAEGETYTFSAARTLEGQPSPSGGDVRRLRRWHAYPMFVTRTMQARSTARSDQADGWAMGEATREDEPDYSALSTPSLTRTAVTPAPAQTVNHALKSVIDVEGIGFLPGVVLGGATAPQAAVRQLQAGQWDAREKGFQEARGKIDFHSKVAERVGVDALFETRWEDGDPTFEVDEAELWTPVMRTGLNMRVAKYRTPFGIANMRSPDDYVFVDAPLALSRLLGPQGLSGGLGAELAYGNEAERLRAHVGAQNGDDSGMVPFLGNADPGRLGGRPQGSDRNGFFERLAYYARLQKGFGLGCGTFAWIGASAMRGPNGSGADGDTNLFGIDLHVGRSHVKGGPPSWYVQHESFLRIYEADRFPGTGPQQLAATTLEDWGSYTEVAREVAPKVALGLRADYVSGEGDSVGGAPFARLARNDDPYRDDRFRVSFLALWWPVKTLRLRFEYSFDDARHRDDPTHMFWVAFEGNWGFSSGTD